METTIKINTDFLNIDILEGIKRMFPHKMVEITVQVSDATDYIMSNPAYSNELKDRIAEYSVTKKGIEVKADELI